MRNFDVKQQYEAVKKSAIDAVKNIFPVDGKMRVLRLEKAWVDDTLDSTDYTSQAKAKEKEQTWGASVYADLSLVEKTTGKVVDHAPKVRLFTLPKITDRFSYIVNGNEYQVHNQLRLKPGIYTLRKQNGELKTQFNLGVGKNFDLAFKESNGVFYLQKIGGGSASIPLYPVLSYLGVSPSLIASTWGSQIEAANRNTDPKVVQKAAASFGIKKGTLKEYLARTRLSPETTKLVLGVSFERVDGPALLAASKHLLDVHLGKKDPVDRDSLAFKELHGVEDFVQLRLEKNKDSLLHKIRRSIDNPNREKISQIVNPASFNSVVETFFTQDDKSATPEQTNPLEMISGAYKATIMGSGGIKSRHAVTPEMRNVHHSHYGLLDPAHTPESDKVGANLTMAVGAIKDGKSLKMVVIGKDGKPATLSAEEAYGKYIAFPDQKGDTVKAMHQGNIVEIPKEKVDFKTPHPGSIFSMSSNLIPYLPSNQGNRATMASKMLEQAIGLKHREAPLVQVGLGDGTSMEEQIGRTVAKMAPEDGTVKQVTPDHIILSTASGDKKINLYNNFSLNRKSFMHHDPVVKKGDRVKKGQLLAESNFTRGGTLALGTNLRTAYLPYKGYNFEDGIVITESAAEKLTSEHIYKKSYDIDDTSIVKLSAFTSFYPNTIKYGSARKLDPDGVIKKGERVEQGDVVIAALRKRSASATIRVISKALSERPKDDSVYWNQEDPGTVLDVQKTPKKITVLIKTEEKAKIGDKLSGRMGNKGIITKILPDNEAPHSADGKPVDILLNPHGVISRINIGQIYESAAAKAATKAGEPHRVRNFSGENYLESTKDFISKHGVEDKEELFDPETGKSLGRVHVGNPHILKLFKQSTANYSARQGGPGTAYDINKQPIKAGGDEGSKALDVLTFYSMLSHGARANLREMASVKSTQNDEYWKALKSGQLLPPPQSPFAYDKFMSYLKAAGVDVKKEGNSLALEPLTDKQVLEMSSAAITKPLLFRAKDMQPIPGGFFDPARLGGFKGEKWGHIELKEPIVNPVFESAVKKITGLGNKLDGITSGKTYVDETGKLNTEKKGLTGGAGVERLLKAINVDEQIKTLTKKALTAKSDQLDDLNKRIRYLTALKESGLRPEEAYIRRHIPVLPPVMRPIYPLPNGDIQTSDTNLLYQNAGIMNYVMNLPVMNLLGDEDKADVRKDLYESAKGISGVTSLNIKGRVRDGFIGQIKGGTGGQPKEGFFISKLLSKKQDYVGRGTIIPEPSLGVDQMAMPEEMAWKLFEPFIVRELSKFGKTPISAKKEIQQKTALAKKALEIVMRDRHVLLNRAPSLHKFSIMAFKPTITQGKAVKIPPLVTKAYNADFDGDTMTVHVPISDEANKEAEKMLPSRNLFQPGSGRLMMAPSQESQIGLFYLSKTPQGRDRINKLLPPKFQIKGVLNKKETVTLLQSMSKEMPPANFGKALAEIKAEGDKHAFERGFTLGLEDIFVPTRERDAVGKKIQELASKAKTQKDLEAINAEGTHLINSILDKHLEGKENPLYDMVTSGARGEKGQLRQILAAPLFVQDTRGGIVPRALTKSYAEGLDVADYWTSMYGARRGIMDRSIQTSLPGAFSKDIMATTLDNVVSAVDCGTKEGILHKVDDPDCLDRLLAGDQGGMPHNTVVTSTVISTLRKKGVEKVNVRSPLRCRQPRGTCARCYGLDEHGQLPEVGDNIGAKAGQTMAEPLVQLVMNTKHTGGAAGTGASVSGYQRINQLLQLPKTLVSADPLSPVDGKVTKIQPGIAGGFDVWVGDKKVHVPQGNKLTVQVGSKVLAGDVLSDGVVRPQDLVKYKGMKAAQDYITTELKNSYKAQGQTLHRKVFETVVRSLGNTTQVINNPKDSGHLPGDIIPYTVAEAHNQNLVVTKPVDEAVGFKTAEKILSLPKGHEITAKDLVTLKGLGIKEVKVEKDPIVHAPFLKGMSNIPLLKKNWMAALGYRQLEKNIVEGASQRWTTDLSDYHPIPAFAKGTEFGKGKEGKY